MAGILTGKKWQGSVQALFPLLAAAVCVGSAAGISVSEETTGSEAGMEPDLEDIARQNGFRTREVVIAGAWWNKDHGPLLGYWEKDGSPVALIPKGAGAYVSIDPQTGENRKIDMAVAADLSPKAHMFYRPFPHKRLDWFDLLKFGFFRRGTDLCRFLTIGSLAGLLGLIMPLATGIILGTFIPMISCRLR